MFQFFTQKKSSLSSYFNRAADYTYPRINPEKYDNRAYFWVQGPLLVTEVFGDVDIKMATELARISDLVIDRQPYLIALHNWVGIESVSTEVQEYLTEYSSTRASEGKIQSIAIYGRVTVKLLATSFKFKLSNRGKYKNDITKITRTMDDFQKSLDEAYKMITTPNWH